MNILRVIELPDPGEVDVSFRDGFRFERTFHVLTDTYLDTQRLYEVRNAIDPNTGLRIPSLGDIHPTVGYAGVINVRPKRNADNHFLAEVSVSYESRRVGVESWQPPLQRRPRFRWSNIIERAPYAIDAKGKLVANSAGQLFTSLPERDTGYLSLTFVRNEATHSVAKDEIFRQTVNRSAWNILGYSVAPGQSYVQSIESELAVDASEEYFETIYTILFRRNGWRDEILDQGYMQIEDDGPYGEPILVNITELDAVSGESLVNQPVLLKNGKVKPLADPPVFLPYDPYPEADHGGMGLPTTWPP